MLSLLAAGACQSPPDPVVPPAATIDGALPAFADRALPAAGKSAPGQIVVVLFAREPGTMERQPGPPGQQRLRLVGHHCGSRFDDAEVFDPAAAEARLAALCADPKNGRVLATSGQRTAPRLRIESKPGTYYCDVEQTSAMALRAGFTQIECGGGVR